MSHTQVCYCPPIVLLQRVSKCFVLVPARRWELDLRARWKCYKKINIAEENKQPNAPVLFHQVRVKHWVLVWPIQTTKTLLKRKRSRPAGPSPLFWPEDLRNSFLRAEQREARCQKEKRPKHNALRWTKVTSIPGTTFQISIKIDTHIIISLQKMGCYGSKLPSTLLSLSGSGTEEDHLMAENEVYGGFWTMTRTAKGTVGQRVPSVWPVTQ